MLSRNLGGIGTLEPWMLMNCKYQAVTTALQELIALSGLCCEGPLQLVYVGCGCGTVRIE